MFILRDPLHRGSYIGQLFSSIFLKSLSFFYSRCAEGFGGKRCNMKTPTTYNHSSMYSTLCEHNTYLGSYYC